MSRGLAEQGSVGKDSNLTAAAENLGIAENVSQLSDAVKIAISLFSDVADDIDNHLPVRGGKKPISAENLAGTLVANANKDLLIERKGGGKSVYLTIGNHTLRISQDRRFSVPNSPHSRRFSVLPNQT